jgi:hypothetical protein
MDVDTEALLNDPDIARLASLRQNRGQGVRPYWIATPLPNQTRPSNGSRRGGRGGSQGAK